MSKQVFWCGKIGPNDDFGDPILGVFYDARTKHGPWGIMSGKSWEEHGGTRGQLGTGLGQKYRQQDDGRWLKVEG